MKPLKIGLVFDDSLDKTDGVAQYVLITGQWLAAQGHDVHYLVGQTARKDLRQLTSLSRNVRVRFNRNRMSMPLPVSGRKIQALLEREQFDVLHVQMPYSPVLAGRIIAAAGERTSVVGTFHILPYSRFVHAASKLVGWAQRRSLQRFDGVMSTSPPAAEFAKKAFGASSQVVPLGIRLDQFLGAKPFAQYAQSRTVVTVGRLVPRKGCQYLLAAVSKLAQQGRLPADVRVVVCGAGPLEAKLKAYVRARGLIDQVEFKGFISEADKPRYLASADIAVYPSTGGESFGIVLLEAMAAARGAVLAGDNPGYASVIGQHSEALFEPQKTDVLADKLAGLLENQAARQAAHVWQQSHIRQFDVGVVGQQVLEVYKEALRKRRK